MAMELDVEYIQFIPIRNKKLYIEEMFQLSKDKKYLVIDEIYDTGETFYKVYNVMRDFNCDYAFLMRRFKGDKDSTIPAFIGKILNHNKWIVFPWEVKTFPIDYV